MAWGVFHFFFSLPTKSFILLFSQKPLCHFFFLLLNACLKLDFLYARTRLAYADGRVGLWMLFFYDLWNQNKTMAFWARNPAATALLDKNRPSALAYRPMPRAELEAELRAAGLLDDAHAENKRRLVFPAMLDALYSRLDDLDAGVMARTTRAEPF